ncbi:hypothetical protein BYT27DRAFT_7263253 [Phlegmacium glaucopus]|nr:hypothetical protein BYT27DRAFT_7263253 [Phlegmacium glaucopus]
MSSRLQNASSTLSPLTTHDSSLPLTPHTQPVKAWVDPASLPHCHHESPIKGNAPDYVKQLNYNTFMCYGVGEEDSFGYNVGKAVKFIEVNVNRKLERQGRLEATTIAEIVVTKHMLNGAKMLHGGCVAYLIDNTPLAVLGLIQSVNGVGVTQSMNVLFHAPAPIGTCLQITSTSISLGGRVMSSRCELVDKDTGRVVASAYLNKMQPTMSKL